MAVNGCENDFEGFKWSKNATLLLISLIKENYNQLQMGVKKVVFKKIAKVINTKIGSDLTVEQISTKWKGLKRQYRKIKNANPNTRQARKSWKFYSEVDEILHHDPEINPPATLSTEDISASGSESEFVDDIDYNEVSTLGSTYIQEWKGRREDIEEEATNPQHHTESMDVSDNFVENEFEGFKWSKNATLLLISLVKENYSQLQKGVKKFEFQEIAKAINARIGTNLTYEQVDTKWKGLKRTYNKINNTDTGQERKFWEFYGHVDKILRHNSENKPPALMTNDDISGSDSKNDGFGFIDCSEEAICTTFLPSPKRRHQSFHEDIEAAKERRHQEKMALAKQFIDLFEKMVDKM